MKYLLLLGTVAMITVKMYFIHFIAAVVKENYSFIKIMQPINPNYTWENGVTQIKIAEENLSVTKGKDPSIRVKMHQTFFCFYNSFWYICWVGVIHLTCLVFFVFFKSPWWLVWIICAPTLLTWKIKLQK